MSFVTRRVTRFGRPMILLCRKDGMPLGYFLPAEVAQAKVDFCNKFADLAA